MLYGLWSLMRPAELPKGEWPHRIHNNLKPSLFGDLENQSCSAAVAVGFQGFHYLQKNHVWHNAVVIENNSYITQCTQYIKLHVRLDADKIIF